MIADERERSEGGVELQRKARSGCPGNGGHPFAYDTANSYDAGRVDGAACKMGWAAKEIA
jgi:hypothetical protein